MVWQHSGMILGFGKGRGGRVWRPAAEFGWAGRDGDRSGAPQAGAPDWADALDGVAGGARNLSEPRKCRAFPGAHPGNCPGPPDLRRKLVASTSLRGEVARLLRADCSPGQIAGRLRGEYLHRPERRVKPRDDLAGAVRAGQGIPLPRWPPRCGSGGARRRRPSGLSQPALDCRRSSANGPPRHGASIRGSLTATTYGLVASLAYMAVRQAR